MMRYHGFPIIKRFISLNSLHKGTTSRTSTTVTSCFHISKIPKTLDAELPKIKGMVKSPENSHLIKAVVIGIPGSGKSSIINSLVGQKVTTSSRSRYTTLNLNYIYTTLNNVQLVLIDTPGIESLESCSRFHIKSRIFPSNPATAFDDVDLIVVIQDVSDSDSRDHINPQILKYLILYSHIPSILVLNKVDLVRSKSSLLFLIKQLTDGQLSGKQNLDNTTINRFLNKRMSCLNSNKHNLKQSNHLKFKANQLYKSTNFTRKIEQQAILSTQGMVGWPHFQDVFLVSNKSGEGIDRLRSECTSLSYPSEWIFEEGVSTDITFYDIIRSVLRLKVIEAIPDNLTYKLQYHIIDWKLEDNGTLFIDGLIHAEHESEVEVLVQSFHKEYKDAIHSVEESLKQLFNCKVVLHIYVESAINGTGLQIGLRHRNRNESNYEKVVKIMQDNKDVDDGKSFQELYLKYIKYFLL